MDAGPPSGPTPVAPGDSLLSGEDPQRATIERLLGASYDVVRLLGRGGMGSVYLARERLLERFVAVKVLRSEFVFGDARDRFIREARTAAKLVHPNIVPLYTFGETADALYYVMGYVEGESLESRLNRQRLSFAESRRLLTDVSDALDYAHRAGVVHRDIKPDNILIDRESGRAILTDFGIAKVQASHSTLTRTGMVIGTPYYMSPEQASGERDIDGRSDLYSLGVVGYRMLAGRLPFDGQGMQDVLVQQVTRTPAALEDATPDVPYDLSWVVTRCLEKDPALRWQSAGALRAALQGSGGEERGTALPQSIEHLPSLGVRWLVPAWIAAVLMLLAWAISTSSGWLAALLALPIALTLVLWPSVAAAREAGQRHRTIWRELASPPERWAGWWPVKYRRSGDVWQWLPGPVRRLRTSISVSLLAFAGFVLPAAALAAVRSVVTSDAALLRVDGATAALVVLVLLSWIAAAHAGADRWVRRAAPGRASLRRWRSEPTWGTNFWRRSEIAELLTRTGGDGRKLALDEDGEDPYCVVTPTQSSIPHGMFDHIDPRSPTPLYAQIATRLRVAIAAGELRPSEALPSVRQLATKLRINPATVVQAYRELEVEGLVQTRHGAGTFVQDVAPERRDKDRAKEARRLVRDLVAQAGGLGITAAELRAAVDAELNGDGRRGSRSK